MIVFNKKKEVFLPYFKYNLSIILCSYQFYTLLFSGCMLSAVLYAVVLVNPFVTLVNFMLINFITLHLIYGLVHIFEDYIFNSLVKYLLVMLVVFVLLKVLILTVYFFF